MTTMMKKKYVKPTAIVEEWKDVVGYEGLYKVSNLGRVKSLKKNGVAHDKLLRAFDLRGLGYMSVRLSKDNKGKTHKVHRLVAQAFIQNPNNLPQVNHKDENKSNNFVYNLEWCDNSYNINYGTRNDKMASKLYKKVNCYTIDGVFIKQYPSVKATEEDGFNATNVSHCLSGRRKNHKGYVFRFEKFIRK